MPVAPDFVVESPDQQVQLIVEAKTKAEASTEWASRMRRNLIVHGSVLPTPFFLLALPTRFFLWRKGDPLEAPPDFEVDPQDFLSAYYHAAPTQLQRLSEESFELVVYAWLSDLVRHSRGSPEREPVWLVRSGLLESIRDGHVRPASPG